MGQEENFKMISQETADELCRAFGSFVDTAERMQDTVDELWGNCLTACMREVAAKYINYMEKYANATFLTRWYWLRKARKVNEALKGVAAMNEDHFKNKKVYEKKQETTGALS